MDVNEQQRSERSQRLKKAWMLFKKLSLLSLALLIFGLSFLLFTEPVLRRLYGEERALQILQNSFLPENPYSAYRRKVLGSMASLEKMKSLENAEIQRLEALVDAEGGAEPLDETGGDAFEGESLGHLDSDPSSRLDVLPPEWKSKFSPLGDNKPRTAEFISKIQVDGHVMNLSELSIECDPGALGIEPQFLKHCPGFSPHMNYQACISRIEKAALALVSKGKVPYVEKLPKKNSQTSDKPWSSDEWRVKASSGGAVRFAVADTTIHYLGFLEELGLQRFISGVGLEGPVFQHFVDVRDGKAFHGVPSASPDAQVLLSRKCLDLTGDFLSEDRQDVLGVYQQSKAWEKLRGFNLDEVGYLAAPLWIGKNKFVARILSPDFVSLFPGHSVAVFTVSSTGEVGLKKQDLRDLQVK